MSRVGRVASSRLSIALVILMLVGLLIWQTMRKAETVVIEQKAAATQSQLDQVAQPVAALCASDAAVRARVGDQTCQVATSAAASVVGPAGPAGAAGEAGRGIVATVIRNDGHLIVTYSDGAKVDVGPVVGKTGENGAPGRGIASSDILAGSLVLTFSDGTSSNLGPVVGEKGVSGPAGADGKPGKDGRGIAKTEIVDGRLIVTYDDQTTTDAGPVPAGANGKDGSPAEAFTVNRSDGQIVECPRTGGTDDHPIYTCNAVPN